MGQVADWLRSQGVAENVINDEAGYLEEHYGEGAMDAARGALGTYQQRSRSGGDRDEGGYDTREGDPAIDNPGDLGDAAYRPPEGQTVTGMWTGQGGGSSSGNQFPDWYRDIIEEQYDQQRQQREQNQERSDALYQTLLDRSNQSLAIDRFDPIIRAQADAYSANQKRAQRDYLSDTAEAAGPLANIQGERRMAAERYGASTGEYEAGLLGQEKAARRAEIQAALSGQMGMLSGDQVRELQRQMALMDQGIKEQQIAMGFRGQDLENDQFLRDLALRDWDRRQYYSPTNPWIYA